MRILVIDDEERNVSLYALGGLKDHEVTTLVDPKEAFNFIKENMPSFDVLLTDLWFPAKELESYCPQYREDSYIKGFIPVGLVFAAFAANKGVPSVICTDSNHHTDRFVAYLDLVYPQENQVITKVEARAHYVDEVGWSATKDEFVEYDWREPDGVLRIKDWGSVLEGYNRKIAKGS